MGAGRLTRLEEALETRLELMARLHLECSLPACGPVVILETATLAEGRNNPAAGQETLLHRRSRAHSVISARHRRTEELREGLRTASGTVGAMLRQMAVGDPDLVHLPLLLPVVPGWNSRMLGPQDRWGRVLVVPAAGPPSSDSNRSGPFLP